MTVRISGAPPDCVGDLPSFTIAYTPPASAPNAAPSTVTVAARKGDGTLIPPTAAADNGDGTWTWTADDPIDVPHTWQWRVVAAGGLVDATEFGAVIASSPFVP